MFKTNNDDIFVHTSNPVFYTREGTRLQNVDTARSALINIARSSPDLFPQCWKILYLYCDKMRDIQSNIAGARGLRLYFIVYTDLSHNTDILNF